MEIFFNFQKDIAIHIFYGILYTIVENLQEDMMKRLYVAYGSNLNVTAIRERCPQATIFCCSNPTFLNVSSFYYRGIDFLFAGLIPMSCTISEFDLY